MKFVFTIVVLSFFQVIALGQSYTVSSSLSRTDGGTCSVYPGKSCVSHSVSSDGVTNKPTSVTVHAYSYCDCFDGSGKLVKDCDDYQTFDLPDFDCFTSTYAFDICGASGTVTISWKPTISTIGPASGTYCTDSTLNFTGTSGWSTYRWFYKMGTGSWLPLRTTTTPSTTVTVQDIYGSNYTLADLATSFYITYDVNGSGCNVNTKNGGTNGQYTFSEVRVFVSATTETPPSCKDGTDAIIKINSISRSLQSGDVVKYTVYTPSNVFVAQVSSSQQPSVANPIEIRGDVSTVAPYGIAPGDYKILVESNSLCGAVTYYTVPTIGNRSQVTFTNPAVTNPSCNANTTGTKNNGSITIDPNGGTGSNYSYSIDNGTTYQSAGSDPFTITGLTKGSYKVIVKDGNGCPSSMSAINVDEPQDILITSADVTSDFKGADISCIGKTDGQITVNATGNGTLNYSKDGSTFQASNVLNLLGAGNYTITVRDANNCTKQSSVVPVVSPSAISATVKPTAALCNGQASGSIDVTTVSGGTIATGNYTYSLDGIIFQSSASFVNQLAGNYTVTVRDENLCPATFPTTITQPGPITVSLAPTLVTCSGGSDGSITITTDATGPTYSLDGINFQTANKFTGLLANTYTVTMKYGNGCETTSNTTVNSNSIITGSIAISTPISCNGGNNGALSLTPGGGVAPYTYLWSNGDTTKNINGLTANIYTVTIKDSKNCQKPFSKTLTQPLPITITATPSDYNGWGVRCFGNNNGSITITPAGGNGGYTYSWSNGATTQNISALTANTYTVTVTDSKSCTGNQPVTITQPNQLITNISNAQNIACFGGNTGGITLNTNGGTTAYQYSINNGTTWQSSPTFTTLTANSYTVLTRDANSCIDTDNVTLTSPIDLVLSKDTIVNTTCNQSNGAAIVSATGGVSAYNFTWFNSSNVQVGTGSTINNLGADVYKVVLTDQNNCSKQQNVPISSSNGPSVTVPNVTPASCSNISDGSATISITGGQAPYTILWSNGQTTATAINLAGGDYTVEVRDQTNCLTPKIVLVPAPPELTIQTITAKDPNCHGNADGVIEVNAQGGNGTYSYSWNTGSTNAILTSLAAGTYTVTTKDIKNCQAVQQFTLIDPPVFTIDLGADQKICEGQAVIRQSDVNNATYDWTGPNSFSSNQQQVSISDPGVYTLSVINQNGCEAMDSFELSFDTNLLKADFLMVSEAYVGDTIVVIDISWPLPTSVNWQFDPAATIIDQSSDYALIQYQQPGTYNTKLMAQLAQCASSYNQWIEIIENPNGEVGGGRLSERILKTVHVYPNPVSEKLTLIIELNRANQATIEMYQLNSNQRALVQSFSGESYYQTDLKLNHLQSGPYVLVVKAGNEIKSLKIIKL